MPSDTLQALLMNSLHCSAVLLCQFAIGQGVHIVNKTSPRGWESWGVADLNEVSIVEEGYDG